MKKTVVAIYKTTGAAQKAMEELLNDGFKEDQVDIAAGENYRAAEQDDNAISRFFTNLFGTHRDRERYSRVAEDNTVLTVYPDSDEQAEVAADILDDHGAIDVDKHYAEVYDSNRDVDSRVRKDEDSEVSDEDRPTVNESLRDSRDRYEREESLKARGAEPEDDYVEDRPIDSGKTIPVMEERATVEKKKVSTGGVRLRSRIIEKPVEEDIRLREEHISVRRKKVDRPATEDELRELNKNN